MLIFVLIVTAVFFGLMRSRASTRYPNAAPPPPQPPRVAEDPVVLLEKLERLRASGALTEAEYQTQKARILRDK